MADISTNMKVTGLSQYKSAFQQAQTAVKTLDSELKKNEAQYKATGDREQYLTEKMKLLQQQMKLQKTAAKQAQDALNKMDQQGVNPLSKSYQDFKNKLAQAETAMIQTSIAMNTLEQSEEEAAKGADQLTTSLNGINKKISLDQVIGGIDRITGGLENAAKKALELGEKLLSVILDSAAQADDYDTMATRLGLTVEEVQKMDYVASRFEAPVELIGKSWKKLKINMASDNEDIMGMFDALGIQTHEIFQGAHGPIVGAARDFKDVFWDVGEALLHMEDATKQEEIAQKLLGRSWDELLPLFSKGRDAYEDALEAAPSASEEAINNLSDLNDRMAELEKSWEFLKIEVLGAIAPALEKGADALAKLIDKITEYLKTDEGQELLTKLGDAVSGLFDDLASIEPESVVENLVAVFDKIVEGLQWLDNHKGDIVGALRYIVTGWGALRLTGGALQILKLINGLTTLSGGAPAADGTGTGSGTGTGVGVPVIAKEATTMFDSGLSLGMAGGFAAGLVQRMNSVWQNIDTSKQVTDSTVEAWVDGMIRQGLASESDRDNMLQQNLDFIHATQKVEVETEPKVADDTAQKIADDIGTVYVPAQLVWDGKSWGAGGMGGLTLQKHANGLPWVPYDGYIAMLHRGERVMTASENKHYTYTSNNYFGNVNLNNGQDIDALCDSIDRHNRRQRVGYGS